MGMEDKIIIGFCSVVMAGWIICLVYFIYKRSKKNKRRKEDD